MIPKSTHYQVRDSNGIIVFRGNKKDQLSYFKKNGGAAAGLKLYFG
jgi:hypothetical protein